VPPERTHDSDLEPIKIHVIPSPMTTRKWKRLQGSCRAGMGYRVKRPRKTGRTFALKRPKNPPQALEMPASAKGAPASNAAKSIRFGRADLLRNPPPQSKFASRVKWRSSAQTFIRS
jgi:hypothetical protein